MRNINGECMAKFCWDGSPVDAFDCYCPDKPSDNNQKPTGGGATTITTKPVCL